MPKTINTVLFDFDSVIDIELSVIRYIDHENWHKTLDWIDKKSFARFKSTTDLASRRMNAPSDLFKSIIKDGYPINYNELMYSIWNRDKDIIIKNNLYVITDMVDLIQAYKKAGDGIVKTAVRVDDNLEENLIKHVVPGGANTITQSRDEINLEPYSRIICGDYRNVFKFHYKQPKSIVVLNYRDNFSDDDITLIRPELIINLSELHEISVVPAYKNLVVNFKEES